MTVGCAVVDWSRSRPLACVVRDSNPGQGRNLKQDFCFIRTPAVVKACHPWVLGQYGSGQNGTDKMVWTKWYTDKMALDKMVWRKWHGQNGTDKILRISHQSIPLPLTI